MQCVRRAEEHHFAALFTRPGAHVQQTVGGKHDLRIMFHHHQRIAGVTQFFHHADDPSHVARMQADGGFIQHEQGVDQRGAQRGGEVDALHFATGQGARLTVECEIAQADFTQIAQPGADLGQQQIGGLVQRRRQLQALHEALQSFHRQQHQVVQRQARQRFQLCARPGCVRWQAALRRGQHGIGVAARAQAPQQ